MPPSPFSLPPPHLLLFQLLSASAAIGLTPSTSWLRPAALPVLSTCSFYIIRDAAQSMRPRWAALLGGFSVAIVLRYLDIGLLSRWSYENHGPAPSRLSSSPSGNKERDDSFLQRLKYGWYTLWSFRQVNTPWEVKNVPTFSTSVPSYVPSRGPFVVQQAAAAWTCYILLDLLAQRAPPANPAQLFDPKLVPVFARWHSVTASEVKLRFLTIAGFAATFYCIIQGFQSMAAALAVGAGVSPVENWRPAFGSVLDAYSLKNVWGKFWHQLLRRPLSAPAHFLTHNILHLPAHSSIAGVLTILTSFALSGLLHTAAGVASGMPVDQLGVFRFFCTQAVGVVVEQGVVLLIKRMWRKDDEANEGKGGPAWYVRGMGYVWVVAFMTWTGPSWIYPQAARAPARGAAAFLPFSVVGWMKSR